MPILHSQFTGQLQAADGTSVPAPPSLVLIQRGPVLQVTVGISQSIAQQLVQRGEAVPAPISGLALVDTGASVTCIDDGAAQQLQLPVIDRAHMASASHAATQQNVYPVHMEISGLPVPIEARAMGAALTAQGLVALIGRDLLQHFTLFYNGVSGEITLAI